MYITTLLNCFFVVLIEYITLFAKLFLFFTNFKQYLSCFHFDYRSSNFTHLYNKEIPQVSCYLVDNGQ